MTVSPLFTDLYELTMAQGYFKKSHNPVVVFDMFFRRHAYGGGFEVFCGLEDLLRNLTELKFSSEDIRYLQSLGIFDDDFLEYLKGFRFTGDLFAFDEGSLVFPEEPLIRIHAPLIEAQLIESLLLNVINFQTLIATKAARLLTATRFGQIMEFGMRRAQGYDGALRASRAAYIGGAAGTSNTLAGKTFGIPVLGTMAHSWIMAFDSEEEAFNSYAELYPNTTVLLIDTYDTLTTGIRHAISTGLKLKEQGRNFGVRLDSGDLSYLSKQVRKELDKAGLTEATIAVSGDLNEQIAGQLIAEGAPINAWGVGTQLTTGHPDAALTGVYKLSARLTPDGYIPTMKVSNNPVKMTNPGIKQVYRFYDEDNLPIRDLIALDNESLPADNVQLFHPTLQYKHTQISGFSRMEPQLKAVMRKGKILERFPSIAKLQEKVRDQLLHMDESYLRIINPHEYKISISTSLRDLKFRMIDEFNR